MMNSGGGGGWEDGHTVRKHRVAPSVIYNGIPYSLFNSECVLMNCVFFNLVYRVLLRRGDIIILT